MTCKMEVANDSLFNLKYADTVSSLSNAARLGDLKIINSLLLKGHLPQLSDNRGWCAIHTCVAAQQLEVLKLLLNFDKENKKFLTNLCTSRGESPLIIALKSESVSSDIVKVLLESGTNVNTATKDGMTALHFACRREGNTDIVRLLVDHGANVNATEFDCGLTPLHFAIETRNTELVTYLLDICDVNLADFYLRTPLFKACDSNFSEAVKLILLKDLTSINIMSKISISPITAACFYHNLEVVQYLVNAGADVWVRGRACLGGFYSKQTHFLPIHSSFTHLGIFQFLLSVMDPTKLLRYEMSVDSASLPIYVMMYAQRPEYFEALLQHPFPPGFDDLKTVRFSKLVDFILHADYAFPETMLAHFQLFFKYCSYFEPENVFEHFTALMSDDELLEKHDFLHLLAKMGISSCDSFESRRKVIRLLVNSSKTTVKKETVLDIIELLSLQVLTLRQLSRVVMRRFIRSLTESDWAAYVMIRNSRLPSWAKDYLWYQILD